MLHSSHIMFIFFTKHVFTSYSYSNLCTHSTQTSRMHVLSNRHWFNTDLEVLVCFMVYKVYLFIFMYLVTSSCYLEVTPIKHHTLSAQHKDSHRKVKYWYSDTFPGIYMRAWSGPGNRPVGILTF